MKKTFLLKLTQVAILIAIEVVLSRFCSIATPIVKIGFGFIPIAIAGMLYGPLWAGTVAGLGDFIGAILFPIGAYFPGFTLTAALSGMVYGSLLHNHKSWGRIIAAVLIISLGLHLCLDTLWLQMITGKGYMVLLPVRVLKSVIMAPMQVVIIRFISTKLYYLPLGPIHKKNFASM